MPVRRGEGEPRTTASWKAPADRRVADKYLADIAGDIRSDLSELASTRTSALDRIGASSYILRQAGVPTSRELAAAHLLICLAREKKAHEALRLLEAGRS